MEANQIKLVASDVDGTLIKNSTSHLYPEMKEAIRELKKRGIYFCAASGRQYNSIRNVFAGVEEDIIYISDNGAQIRRGEERLRVTGMRRDVAEAIILQLREYDNKCDMVVSTADECLMESKNKEFIHLMTYGYHNTFRLVEDVLQEKAEIIKISLYCEESIQEIGEGELIPRWRDKVKVCMAGEEWVDFMDLSVDKGNALGYVQQYLGVTREETMAFGDHDNDIGMMYAAGASYAVENAREEVKRAAKFLCPSYLDRGVYQVIRRLYEEGEMR